MDKDIIQEHRLLKPQYLYIYGFNNECKADYIGRFENGLDLEWAFISARIGIKERLPHLNASVSKVGYRKFYKSDYVKNFVTKVFEEDLNNFNYDF